MKKVKYFALPLLLIASLIGAAFLGQGAKPSYAEEKNQKQIKVQGQAVLKVKPDVAYVTVGVDTEDQKSDVAQAQNKKIMNQIMAALKANGIQDKDIQTSEYRISPNYTYNEKERKSEVTGYRVSNSVDVTIKDIGIVGKILDDVAQTGANDVRSIRFGIQNEEQYYLDALAQAVKNGKGKADAIAKAIGVSISVPSEVVENYSGGASIMDSNYFRAEAKMDMGTPTPVSPGELEIRANVSLSYGY